MVPVTADNGKGHRNRYKFQTAINVLPCFQYFTVTVTGCRK